MDLARHFPGFLHANATDHHCWISMSDSASIFAQTTASDQFPVLCDIGSRCMLASDHSLALNHRNPHHHPVDNTNAIVDTKCTIKKRESMAVSDITSSVISSSIPVHGCGMEGIARTSETNIFGGGKRRRNSKKQAEKLREVIHVRAKRGQAADNHSLAERARREKINERIRCLQELVPGCYKTMGMAVTLDEIINYVQSLQNQVEFLSMKLSAASSLCDFNSDTEPGQISYSSPCARDNPYEARDMEWLVREAYDGAAATTRFCPFDFTFGSCLHSPFSSSLCSKWKCT